MSNFNPAINDGVMDPQNTGYGRVFCKYPVRRADYAINNGMNQYQFSFVKHTRDTQSLNPRPAMRENGNMNQYRDRSRIESIPNYSTPYSQEKKVQDRGVPLNRDLVAKRLVSAPSKTKKKLLQSHIRTVHGPKVTIPNPKIPTYNHIIPYQYVEQFGECPCTPHTFQATEHVWSNGTRVKGYDPRLGAANSRPYQRAIRNSRPFPRVHNVNRCKVHGGET